MKIITISLIAFSIVLSCKNANSATDNKDSKNTESSLQNTQAKEQSQKMDAYEIIIEEPYGGLEEAEDRVVRSQEELNKIYSIINRFRRPGIETPEIDFKKETVIAIFLGEKTTGGFSVDIASVKTSKNKIEVNYKVASPKPDEPVTTAICQPFCFIKIPHRREKVEIKLVN